MAIVTRSENVLSRLSLFPVIRMSALVSNRHDPDFHVKFEKVKGVRKRLDEAFSVSLVGGERKGSWPIDDAVRRVLNFFQQLVAQPLALPIVIGHRAHEVRLRLLVKNDRFHVRDL